MDKYVERQEVLKFLNVKNPAERLANLAIVLGSEKEKPEVKPQFANNHIHTIYSFRPILRQQLFTVRETRACRQPASWIMTALPVL